jgi:hypothetical protein
VRVLLSGIETYFGCPVAPTPFRLKQFECLLKAEQVDERLFWKER